MFERHDPVNRGEEGRGSLLQQPPVPPATAATTATPIPLPRPIQFHGLRWDQSLTPPHQPIKTGAGS